MSPSKITSSHFCSILSSTPTSFAILAAEKQHTVRQYVTDILKCYNTLASFSSLHPSSTVNQAFSELMSICSQVPEESIVYAILTDPEITKIVLHLQQICSVGESDLERFWAEKIASSSLNQSATSLLSNFTYYENYVDLTKMELSAISLASPGTSPPRRFAFLGCGPLPLTSLCILSQLRQMQPQNNFAPSSSSPFILNIDRNPSAIVTAIKLRDRLGHPSTAMGFLCDEAGGTDLSPFDVVYLAALVGATQEEKREIVKAVLKRMRPGALLVVRTAHALRSLLYPIVRVMSDLDAAAFEPLLVVHPYNHIINSIIIGRVRAPHVV